MSENSTSATECAAAAPGRASTVEQRRYYAEQSVANARLEGFDLTADPRYVEQMERYIEGTLTPADWVKEIQAASRIP